MKANLVPMAGDLTLVTSGNKTVMGVFSTMDRTVQHYVQTKDPVEYIDSLLRDKFKTLEIAEGSSYTHENLDPVLAMEYDHLRNLAIMAETVAVDELVADKFRELSGK